MQKVGKLLVEHGYKDDGAFVIYHNERNFIEHFWQEEYNQPLITFFKNQST
jgi:hypothetical protein